MKINPLLVWDFICFLFFSVMIHFLCYSRNIKSFMGLMLSSTTDSGMPKMLELVNLETRIPYATHHFFVKKNSQPMKAHLNEEVVYTAMREGWIA